ncbi:hypothetical protein PT276_08160 [Orbaceae bacterium ESL0721]|nr:hypothetical protein [Orbaceae bacterium ESL0721]
MEGDSLQTQYLKNSLAATVKQTQLMQETAQSIGEINSALYSISDTVSSFAGAGKLTQGTGQVSLSAGVIQGYADYEQGLAEGLDKETAAEKAFITGGGTALGGYVPLTMGFKLSPFTKAFLKSQSKGALYRAYGEVALTDIGHTAGANIAVGVGSRGFTHDILKANGYDQMAAQYTALDDSAMLVDGTLGLIFGGVAKYGELRQQHTIDALLLKNNQLHQTGAAPGVPTDVESMNLHNKALNKAFEDMISGQPVDVSEIVQNGNFIIKDDTDWHSLVLEAIERQYPDEAVYFTKKGTPIPAKLITELKEKLSQEVAALNKEGKGHQEVNAKDELSKAQRDLKQLENGIVPERFIKDIVDSTGLKASELKDSFAFYDTSKMDQVSDTEFKKMQENAEYDERTAQDVIGRILNKSPNMEVSYFDDAGVEKSAKAADLITSAMQDVERAQADKKLYEAAAACLMRNMQ